MTLSKKQRKHFGTIKRVAAVSSAGSMFDYSFVSFVLSFSFRFLLTPFGIFLSSRTIKTHHNTNVSDAVLTLAVTLLGDKYKQKSLMVEILFFAKVKLEIFRVYFLLFPIFMCWLLYNSHHVVV